MSHKKLDAAGAGRIHGFFETGRHAAELTLRGGCLEDEARQSAQKEAACTPYVYPKRTCWFTSPDRAAQAPSRPTSPSRQVTSAGASASASPAPTWASNAC